MSMRPTTTDLLRVGPTLFWFLLLSSALGCCHSYSTIEGLDQRILAPVSPEIGVRNPESLAGEGAQGTSIRSPSRMMPACEPPSNAGLEPAAADYDRLDFFATLSAGHR